MQLSERQLVLFPAQAETQVGAGQLYHAVQSVGLLGAELAAGTYAVGEQFLSLVCFLGCSPDIELSPHAGKPFCYVQLPTNGEPVAFQPLRRPARSLRCWVAVGNIYESEAIPDAALLQVLEAASGSAWKFAYGQIPDLA